MSHARSDGTIDILASLLKEAARDKLDCSTCRDQFDTGWFLRYGRSLLNLQKHDEIRSLVDAFPKEHEELQCLRQHLLGLVWTTEGKYEQAVNELSTYVKDATARTDYLANVWSMLGLAHYRLGDFDEARSAAEQSMRLYQSVGDTNAAAACNISLSNIERRAFRWNAAVEQLESAAELLRRSGSPYLGGALQNLGLLQLFQGHLDSARDTLTEVLKLAKQAGTFHREAEVSAALGYLHVLEARYGQARPLLAFALRFGRANGTESAHQRLVTICRLYIGELHLAQGHPDRARSSLQSALKQPCTLAVVELSMGVRRMLAEVELLDGNDEIAVDHASQALEEGISLGDPYDIAVCRRVLGQSLLCLGRWEEARTHLRDSVGVLDKIPMSFEHRRVRFLLDALSRERPIRDVRNTWLINRAADNPQAAGRERHPAFSRILGADPTLLAQLEQARRQAESSSPILVRGESGTGKELLARAIHELSPRAKREFVVFNSAASSPELIESELFGHVRGAFTGAGTTRTGLVHRAHGGTLFLDEVAELPTGSQTRLLRLLDSGEVRPVGGDQSKRVDFRLITATHRDLEEMVASRKFRADLYHRISTLQTVLPPLRKRHGDIELLARHFAHEAKQDYPEFRGLSQNVIDSMKRHWWPGNVRELRNQIQQLASQATPASEWSPGGLTKEALFAALEQSSGNVALVAVVLRTSRQTIYRRAKDWKIDIEYFRRRAAGNGRTHSQESVMPQP